MKIIKLLFSLSKTPIQLEVHGNNTNFAADFLKATTKILLYFCHQLKYRKIIIIKNLLVIKVSTFRQENIFL